MLAAAHAESFTGAPPVVQVVHRLPNPPTGREVFGDEITPNPRDNGEEGGDAEQQDAAGDRADERRYLENEGIYEQEGRPQLPPEAVGADPFAVPGDLYDMLGSSQKTLGAITRTDAEDMFYGRRPY